MPENSERSQNSYCYALFVETLQLARENLNTDQLCLSPSRNLDYLVSI